MTFRDLHQYFDGCALVERLWRARVAINPKTAKANRSVEKFHRQYPEHVVNLAQWRIARARRQAASRNGTTAAL